MRLFSLFEPVPKNGGVINALFFGWGIFVLSVLLLYCYCTTTVPYQASDVVDCGGECRLEAKVFSSFLGVIRAWFRAVGDPQTPTAPSRRTADPPPKPAPKPRDPPIPF